MIKDRAGETSSCEESGEPNVARIPAEAPRIPAEVPSPRIPAEVPTTIHPGADGSNAEEPTGRNQFFCRHVYRVTNQVVTKLSIQAQYGCYIGPE